MIGEKENMLEKLKKRIRLGEIIRDPDHNLQMESMVFAYKAVGYKMTYKFISHTFILTILQKTWGSYRELQGERFHVDVNVFI
ncbi:hypothetical protein TNCV_5073301 [Trichonephila clavipes]|nr:hypothetical protein TNCV_5073301 [Trichonephila clavipes]